MSHVNKDPYVASCNPPRRAKRPRSTANELDTASLTQAPQPRPLLPKQAAQSLKPPSSSASSASPIQSPTSEPTVVANAPSKRGRKPGPLSRSAREAQRRLNHSIIEKARRTKINNALATLKELVPPDYGKKAKAQDQSSDEDDDGDDDDEDGAYGVEKKPKAKTAGKKEEKEREYKLEILVRTVSFVQDLLQRVAKLEEESPVCSSCGGNFAEATKQKSDVIPPTSPNPASPCSNHSDSEIARRTKRARIESRYQEHTELVQAISPLSMPSQENTTKHRLPSISSWLPETLLDPPIFNVSSPFRVNQSRNSKDSIPPLQLPTPPLSNHLSPITTMAGPTSVISSIPSAGTMHQKMLSPAPIRTPEDEHAATMLLQISGGCANSSPTFRPLPPSIIPVTETRSSTSPALPPTLVGKANLGFIGNQEGISVQTPASLLGLITPPTR